LPLWLSNPEYHGAAADLIGISLPSFFLRYTGSYIGAAIIYTWLYNRTSGSIFLPMVFHASINTTLFHFYEAFVPSLFPIYPQHLLYSKVGFGLFALLIIGITGGRLGYLSQKTPNKACSNCLESQEQNPPLMEKPDRLKQTVFA
jgi:hypothetical protein